MISLSLNALFKSFLLSNGGKLNCSNRLRLELIVYCRVCNILMYEAIYLLTQFFHFTDSEKDMLNLKAYDQTRMASL
jgi:hypothetical protein